MFVFGQQVSEVAIVAAHVGGAGQRKDPFAEGIGEPARGGSAAVAVREGGEAVLPDAGQQPFGVPDRDAHERGGVSHGESPVEDLADEMGPLLLLAAQDEFPPGHEARVTESMSS